MILLIFSLLSGIVEGSNGSNINRHLKTAPPKAYRSLVEKHGYAPLRDVDYGGLHPFELYQTRQLQIGFDPQQKNLQYGNRDAYEKIRIKFITEPLESLRGTSSIADEKIGIILDTILPAVDDAWASRLKVFPVSAPITIVQQECFGFFEDFFPQSQSVDDADLVIIVSSKDEFCDPGVLGFASACTRDQFDRPVIGLINFCLPDDAEQRFLQEKLIIDQDQVDIKDTSLVAIHEVGHVLGVNLEAFQYFRNPITGEPLTPRNANGEVPRRFVPCIDGNDQFIRFPADNTLQIGTNSRGQRFYEVVTPRVQTVARNILNCQSLMGARLENQPTNEDVCAGSHWDERLFLNELMSPFFDGAGEGKADTLSPLTLALMDDSGWYKVNYQDAKISPYGHGAGCDFVNEDCIVNDAVPDHSRGYFCDTPLNFDPRDDGLLSRNQAIHCDPSHTVFALCDLADIGEDIEVSYFSNPNLGAITSIGFRLDSCPAPTLNVDGLDLVDCTDPDSAAIAVSNYAGETYGPTSRCINARLGNTAQAACLSIECDLENFQVIVGGQVCEKDFEILQLSPLGQMECPRLAAVCPQMFCPDACSGRGSCDYDARPPVCQCFDSEDTTASCNLDRPIPPTAAPALSISSVPTAAPVNVRTTAPVSEGASPIDRPIFQTAAPAASIFSVPTAAPVNVRTTAPVSGGVSPIACNNSLWMAAILIAGAVIHAL